MRKLVMIGTVGLLLSTAIAAAQTADPTSTGPSGPTAATETTSGATSTNDGAFAKLSPGNQKIARSLFEAQKVPSGTTAGSAGAGDTATAGTSTGGDGGATTGGATGDSRWTLDQIAAAKQTGQGWGNIFKEMKAQGLIDAKNLGQVVSGKAIPPSPPTNGAGGTGGGTGGDTGTAGGGAGSGSTATGDGASGGTTAAIAAPVRRPVGGRHITGRGSDVTVTLGNNRSVVTSSGAGSTSRHSASDHRGGPFGGGFGAAGRHGGVAIGGAHAGPSAGAMPGGGHGHGRGGEHGGGRGR